MWMIFLYIGNFIIPTDELIFFRRVGIPPTGIKRFWGKLLTRSPGTTRNPEGHIFTVIVYDYPLEMAIEI